MADERHVTVLMADLAGYTALTEAHGSSEAALVVSRYVALAAEATAPGAELIERIGDGLVFVAERPDAAVRTALRLRTLIAHTPRFPHVRAGLHAGPVVLDEGRYVGHALNVAARVTAEGKPGQIVCTESVVREAGEIPDVDFRSMGPRRFRHLVQPVVVYEILASGDADAVTIDPVCRMQVDPAVDTADAVFDGRRYLFCSEACRDAFTARPEDYVTSISDRSGGRRSPG